jgi:hypothetical protein
MAHPFPVSPDITPFPQGATINASWTFQYEGIVYTVFNYVSGGVDNQIVGVAVARVAELDGQADLFSSNDSSSVTNPVAVNDFFGDDIGDISIKDFFTRYIETLVDVQTITWIYPGFNSYYWFNPLDRNDDSAPVDSPEDFFGAGATPTINDFFTALDEVGCKLGSTQWDKPLGFTIWDNGLTCWDVPT